MNTIIPPNIPTNHSIIPHIIHTDIFNHSDSNIKYSYTVVCISPVLHVTLSRVSFTVCRILPKVFCIIFHISLNIGDIVSNSACVLSCIPPKLVAQAIHNKVTAHATSHNGEVRRVNHAEIIGIANHIVPIAVASPANHNDNNDIFFTNSGFSSANFWNFSIIGCITSITLFITGNNASHNIFFIFVSLAINACFFSAAVIATSPIASISFCHSFTTLLMSACFFSVSLNSLAVFPSCLAYNS
ncbi:MAG: hypothetical protein EKK61_04215 [Rickettsiales bacterium]|nr:MAG: hypothetical protein EKK61_04215 [Rickettsiales bacterium]